MSADLLLAAFCGAAAYCVPAELLHRRRLREQIEGSKALLKQAHIVIQAQAVDKMALMGELDVAKADVVALRTELTELYSRVAA